MHISSSLSLEPWLVHDLLKSCKQSCSDSHGPLQDINHADQKLLLSSIRVSLQRIERFYASMGISPCQFYRREQALMPPSAYCGVCSLTLSCYAGCCSKKHHRKDPRASKRKLMEKTHCLGSLYAGQFFLPGERVLTSLQLCWSAPFLFVKSVMVSTQLSRILCTRLFTAASSTAQIAIFCCSAASARAFLRPRAQTGLCCFSALFFHYLWHYSKSFSSFASFTSPYCSCGKFVLHSTGALGMLSVHVVRDWLSTYWGCGK